MAFKYNGGHYCLTRYCGSVSDFRLLDVLSRFGDFKEENDDDARTRTNKVPCMLYFVYYTIYIYILFILCDFDE